MYEPVPSIFFPFFLSSGEQRVRKRRLWIDRIYYTARRVYIPIARSAGDGIKKDSSRLKIGMAAAADAEARE